MTDPLSFLDTLYDALDEQTPGSLLRFVREAWPRVEPEVKLVSAWHLQCVCDHLEAVASGDIKNLLLNLPPATAKSLLVAVFFPCWVWARRPGARFFFASYQQALSTRDSVRRRALLDSPWYQDRWGHQVAFSRDQNQKTLFRNTRMGEMLASSIGGAGTGEHPDFLIADDPNDVNKAESKLQREAATGWWDRLIPTRGVVRGVSRVVVQQRVHQTDLSGHILAHSPAKWTHVVLPMRAEGNRIVNGVGKYAEDPRPEGELLCPKLLNEQQVAEIEAAMGSLRAAGQLQQRPAPPGGALIKESHFRYFWEERDTGPDGGEAVRYVLRDHEGNERRIWKAQCSFWFQTIDTAMEIGQDNDYTVVLTACFTPPPVCTLVQNVFRERVEVPRQFTILMEQRSRFPEVKLQAVEQAASGRGLIQEGRVRGTPFHPLKTGGKDKAARAIAMVTAYENGMIYHKANAPWLAAFEDELLVFPSGEHDDQWDTMAYAGMLMQQHCFTQQTSEGQVVCWPPPPGREEEELPEPRPGMSLAEKLTGRRPGQARFEEEVPWWNR